MTLIRSQRLPPRDRHPSNVVVYSNLEQQLWQVDADVIQVQKLMGQHTAWNYHGWVWHADGLWHNAIHVHHKHMVTYSAPDIIDVIRAAIADYGSD